jgi:lipid-A-disaccharide synthase-like uncharacterized protein
MKLDSWLILGFCAQFLFASRFLYQWLVSEKKKRSVVPKLFWYLSLCGGTLLLIYAVHRKDLVFVAGQAGGLLIYLRNLMLFRDADERT